MSEAKWYVAHTYSGYENKVKLDIEKTVENRGLQDQIFEVSVPLESVLEINKDGKEVTAKKKLFPGYVLVNMIMNDETWYIVRNTRGVTGFVGPGSKPVALTPDEIRALGFAFEDSQEEKEAKFVHNFHVGDMVKVKQGVWKGSVAAIAAINENQKTITVKLDMFDRESKVEMSFSDVEKA